MCVGVYCNSVVQRFVCQSRAFLWFALVETAEEPIEANYIHIFIYIKRDLLTHLFYLQPKRTIFSTEFTRCDRPGDWEWFDERRFGPIGLWAVRNYNIPTPTRDDLANNRSGAKGICQTKSTHKKNERTTRNMQEEKATPIAFLFVFFWICVLLKHVLSVARREPNWTETLNAARASRQEKRRLLTQARWRRWHLYYCVCVLVCLLSWEGHAGEWKRRCVRIGWWMKSQRRKQFFPPLITERIREIVRIR